MNMLRPTLFPILVVLRIGIPTFKPNFATLENESISWSSSKSYMRDEIGYVTEVNFVRM